MASKLYCSKRGGVALFLAGLLQWSLVSTLAPAPAFAQRAYPATSSKASIAQTGQTIQSYGRAVKSGLEAHDKSPLNNRMPLILIHGIGASASTEFNWERFLDFTKKDKALMGRYKIYLYHYDSSRSVPAISQNLQQTLKNFIQLLGHKPIKIVAYSEGGLLTRNAVQDPYLDQYIDEVITIATPFHGSPLANPEWIRQQVKTESRVSLLRMSQRLAYNITGRLYPSFKEDFEWDNFDGAIPSEQYAAHHKKTTPTDYALAHKQRFVTYGSYFGIEVDPAILQHQLGVKTKLPKEKLIFANLFRRNVLFSVVRHNIAKLPLAIIPIIKPDSKVRTTPLPTPEITPPLVQATLQESDSTVKIAHALLPISSMETELLSLPDGPVVFEPGNTAKPSGQLAQASALIATAQIRQVQTLQQQAPASVPVVSMMMFNDGISPISSTLWLGRYMPVSNGAAVSVEKLWDTLRKLKGNHNTRLFAGMDHRNWMDGTTRTGESEIQDLLNPDEPPRTIFAWIVYDLMS
ncbi:esterase/lipase family protein [Vampirovibrio sp.]|uniref:esterase/lipase family protein n=1 Tax=Vampirovibrio sp. TaxID=2717857 RepID=UPI003593D1AC